MCFAKFPPFTMKASPNIACQKIQRLQLLNRNIVAILALQQTLPNSNNSCNFDLALTATSALQAQLYVNVDFPNRIGSRVITKSRLKLETLDALTQVSFCERLLMENMDWAKNLTLGNRPKTGGLCLWSWVMIKCIMQGIKII